MFTGMYMPLSYDNYCDVYMCVYGINSYVCVCMCMYVCLAAVQVLRDGAGAALRRHLEPLQALRHLRPVGRPGRGGVLQAGRQGEGRGRSPLGLGLGLLYK